jgi:hypothetical protein
MYYEDAFFLTPMICKAACVKICDVSGNVLTRPAHRE